MAETTSSSASANAGFDLTQFYQVFFEEAAENLDKMEQLLLTLDITVADDEELNAVFRCAHSIKGGAATFGFADLAELTHEMETLLDRLRRRELTPSAGMVDVLLASGDALRGQLARHRGADSAPPDTRELLASIRALVAGDATPNSALPARAPAPVATRAPSAAASGERVLELVVGPLDSPEDADNLIDLFHEIAGLGKIVPLDQGIAAEGMRRFRITTTSSDDDLLDLFTFHVSREQVKLIAIDAAIDAAPDGDATAAPADVTIVPTADEGYGFFANAPGAPRSTTSDAGRALAAPAQSLVAKPTPKIDRAGVAAESSTLRVSVEKVDQLINLMGELVITQAMLAQTGRDLDNSLHQQLAAGLAALDRNTRDLQEAVMSIRMIPMSVVFSRFPRMLRDLAAKLGKKVDFVTVGDATELDKGLVEKITDPLTHLVRNSCDHGIETPAERIAAGKSETGTITLSAAHQGGSIAIEVRDDGKGLSREKLLKKARERGLHAPDSMSDAEVWNLIFAPGFSTAEVVTDVSGRGVGMDVVKKNITALGGTVEIDSAEGYGMRVSVRLPLTLAIMDAMSVGVGEEVYILPLSSVVESLQVHADLIKTIGGSGRVVEVRDEYMPVLDLEALFDVPRSDAADAGSIMVVIEAEGGRVALLVDELIGQQQVVVKNLEANYRRVDDVSGATIMGDGRVALILDVGSLVRRSRH